MRLVSHVVGNFGAPLGVEAHDFDCDAESAAVMPLGHNVDDSGTPPLGSSLENIEMNNAY